MLFCLGCWTQNLYLVRRKGEDLTNFHLQKFIKWVWIIKYCDLTDRLLCERVTVPLSWCNWIKFCSKYFYYTRGKCFNNIEKPCLFVYFYFVLVFYLQGKRDNKNKRKVIWKNCVHFISEELKLYALGAVLTKLICLSAGCLLRSWTRMIEKTKEK